MGNITTKIKESFKQLVCPLFFVISLLVVTLFGGCTNNEKKSSSVKAHESSGAYENMDYGPVITATIQMSWPQKSLVRKGLAIRLDHNTSMIFDEDLVSFAAGVESGWLDISKTDYANTKGTNTAKIEGNQVFATSDQLAGWTKDGRFAAQRQNNGKGNLPKGWAHYKGYYKYGNKIILSYSVSGTDILELPRTVRHDGSLAFTRTMQISATSTSKEALILKKRDSWSVEKYTNHSIILNTDSSALAVCIINASPKVKLKIRKKGLVTLYVPPSNKTQIIRVAIFKVASWDNNLSQKISEKIVNTKIPNFKKMTEGGPSQWNKTITLSGKLSEDSTGYVLDHIPIPFDNPWGAWMRLSGIDFFDDGTRAAVSTWNGDVWIVSGIDSTLKNVKWHRFASGLFQPVGIAIVKGDIYVCGRSQITKLVDLNDDGEADYYENFNNDGAVYPRELTEGLAVDSKGYFYFFRNGNRFPPDDEPTGSLIRVCPDGTEREVYGRGFRSANTIGIGPHDMILTVDQQGDWVPVDRMDVVKGKGGFYGYRPHGGDSLPVGDFNTPVAWLPHTVDNSAGFIIYEGDNRFGPLADHWIMSSYGQRTLFVVLLQKIEGRLQGGIVRLPKIKTPSGVIRAAVNPADGQLYMVGLLGWGTTATEPSGFSRLRYVGGQDYLPKAMQITRKGIKITFANPVNPASAQNIQNYEIKQWEYIYSKHYGSPRMSLANPNQKGVDTIKISSATVSEDGYEVFLNIPNIRSVMQIEITYNLLFEDGKKAVNSIYSTINWLPGSDLNKRPEWQQRIVSEIRKPVKFNRGQRLISLNDCKSCHAVGRENFGPSFLEIAKRYPINKRIINQLSEKIIHGGSGNWGERAMPPHPTLIKGDAKVIVRYILSLSSNNE